MKCPNCGNLLVPWAAPDEPGYEGVECKKCRGQWKSESFAKLADVEVRNRLGEVLLSMPVLPDDAVPFEDWLSGVGTQSKLPTPEDEEAAQAADEEIRRMSEEADVDDEGD